MATILIRWTQFKKETFNHVPRLLKLAVPMILSSSAIMMMQIIDAIVLSRHSSEAVAAMGPSGLAVILFQGFMFGTAGYAGTFVAHCHGRGDTQGGADPHGLAFMPLWRPGG